MTAPVSTIEMRVQKYIPERLYGFTIGEDGQEVFFHLGSFDPGTPLERPLQCHSCKVGECIWTRMPPPPVLGELVLVEVDLGAGDENKAPRASRVTRVDSPLVVQGEVDTFDALRGYGFVNGTDGVVYHLHKSEVLEGSLPLVGQPVVFYAGLRQGRPRACHVKVCR